MIAATVAVSRAIRMQTDLIPEIKWPNDILIRGKKTAGILTELSAELDKLKYVILGIGVDVNLESTDFSPDLRRIATSLLAESGRMIDRAEELGISVMFPPSFLVAAVKSENRQTRRPPFLRQAINLRRD